MSGILVLRLKGLGDIVHLLPSMLEIRRLFPDTPLGFLCQKPFGEVIPPGSGITSFQLPSHAGLSETLKLVRRIRTRRYDRLFDLFGNPRTALISLLSGIPFRAGFDYRIRRLAYHRTYLPKDYNKHLRDLFADFFRAFGLPLEPGHPKVAMDDSSPKVREALARFGSKPALGVNPHATYPSKAWPPDHFEEFIRLWYAATGGPALITCGPGEESLTRDLLSRLGPDLAFTHPPLGIPEFNSLLSRFSIFLTGDTGPMNLAWAVGTPVAALFGPTTRRAVAPIGEEHLVLFDESLPCLQCHRENCPDNRCMSGMKPEWVLKRIRQAHPRLFPK